MDIILGLAAFVIAIFIISYIIYIIIAALIVIFPYLALIAITIGAIYWIFYRSDWTLKRDH